MKRSRRALTLALAAVALDAGCTRDDPTEIVIVITTNLIPATALRQVRVTAEREGSSATLFDRSYVLEGLDGGVARGLDAGAMIYRIPGEVSFVASNPDDARRLHVSVWADLGNPEENFTQEALVRFRAHQLSYFEMFLPQRCGYPVNRVCGPGLVCGAAGCEPIERTTTGERPPPRDVVLLDAPVLEEPQTDAVVKDAPADVTPDVRDASDVSDASDVIDVSDVSDVGDVRDASDVSDAAVDVVCPTLTAPRLIAPVSGSVVSSGATILEWTVPPGSNSTGFEVCADRACATVYSANPGTPPAMPGQPATGRAPLHLPSGTYFWRARGFFGICPGPWSPVAEFVAPPIPSALPDAGEARVNTYWGAVPDVNGDGFADLLIGTTSQPAGTAPGRVDLYLGSARGVADPSAPTLTLRPPAALSATDALTYGASVAGAGDVNGDGFPDAVVGTRANVAYVYLGNATTGLAATPFATLSNTIGGTVYANFGAPVIGAGDLDHDGYADLASGIADGRAAAVFYGQPTSTGALDRAMGFPMSDGIHAFGSGVAAGDFDGDRYADVIIGAPGAPSGSTGLAYVLWGGASGVSAPVAVNVTAASPGYFFGAALAGGDVNGDGFADVVVGDASNARVNFFQGGRSRALPYIGQVTSGASGLGRFGYALRCAGDLDGDGFADILVGALASNQAFAVLGAPMSSFRPDVVPFATGAAGSAFGAAVAGLGDIDNDGDCDAVVSAASNTDSSLSSVTVYRTAAPSEWRGAMVTAAATVIPGPTPRSGSFGRALGLGR